MSRPRISIGGYGEIAGDLRARCRHLPPGAPEDRPLQPGDRTAVLHGRGTPPPLAIMADHSLDALAFRSREGTPLTTANVRRQLRKVLGDAGIEGVSPHMFRRTVATVINEQASLNLASELLGHTDPKVTIEHYIRRNEQVNPLTAELLDQAFAREDD